MKNNKYMFNFLYFSLMVFCSKQLISEEKISVVSQKEDKYENIKKEDFSLEFLWDKTLKNNFNIKEAEINYVLADKQLSIYWQQYLPSVSFSTTTALSNFMEKHSEIPNNISYLAAIEEKLPGGLNIEFLPNVVYSKDEAFYTQNNSFLKYVDTEKITVSISQNLLPFWLQKSLKNPEKRLLTLEKEINATYLNMVSFSEIENLTKNYIEYRKVSRKIDSIEHSIEIYHQIIEITKELKTNGNVSLKEVFESEKLLSDCYEELTNLQNTKLNLYTSIIHSFGNSITYDDLDLFLNMETELSKNIESLFSKNPTIEYLKLQKEILKENYILTKQNTSPVFSLSGNIPIHNGYDNSTSYGLLMDENNKTWSVTASLNFSPFYESNRNYLNQKYEKENKLFEERIDDYKNQLEYEKRQFEELLQFYEKKLYLSKKEYDNNQKIYEAQKMLFDKKQCSYIEVLQAELTCICNKNEIENSKDIIWLYKWLIINRK